ncbi:hypothetical protein J3454_07085 [Erythrobacter sp. NFXS35]|uniref:hypothetical protein n=1 Tax=Erythrobacter sp. NFXS35 TaxID=2818436 RepID=UPI0032DE4505
MATSRKVNTSLLDTFSVAKMCVDAARPRALLENTRSEWKTDKSYKDDWLFSTAYKVLPWKAPPGTQEIETDHEQVKKRTFTLASSYQATFYRKLMESPVAADKYADSLVKMAADAKDLYLEALKDTRKLNQEVANYWTEHVIALKSLKTFGGLAATLSGGPAAAIVTAQGWASAGIELVQATSLGQAGLVVGLKASQKASDKVVGKFAENAAMTHFKNANVTWKLAQEGQAQMDEVGAKMLGKRSPKKLAKLARKMDHIEAQRASKLASTSRSLTKAKLSRKLIPASVTILFALADVREIIEEYATLD